MDEFFNKKRCDRCGAPLDGGFTMSRFNTYAVYNISVVML